MSNKKTIAIAVLLGIVGMQQWLLYRPTSHGERATSATTAVDAARRADQGIDRGVDDDTAKIEMAERLARIDARLSSLEAGKAVDFAPKPPNIVVGSPEALAADRKIAALLPNAPMTQAQLFELQSRLAQYPMNERIQLSAALARAINNGRVQISSTP